MTVAVIMPRRKIAPPPLPGWVLHTDNETQAAAE